jgi:DeoR/GlpR family transcriptional regulator of sugar metabolism
MIKEKGTVYIKDISTILRDVSEKTIQRELQKLVLEGKIAKKGSRRWTEYSFI